jgi:hypothetical protein
MRGLLHFKSVALDLLPSCQDKIGDKEFYFVMQAMAQRATAPIR